MRQRTLCIDLAFNLNEIEQILSYELLSKNAGCQCYDLALSI